MRSTPLFPAKGASRFVFRERNAFGDQSLSKRRPSSPLKSPRWTLSSGKRLRRCKSLSRRDRNSDRPDECPNWRIDDDRWHTLKRPWPLLIFHLKCAAKTAIHNSGGTEKRTKTRLLSNILFAIYNVIGFITGEKEFSELNLHPPEQKIDHTLYYSLGVYRSSFFF